MKTQVYDVTPELADHWLKQCNVINFRAINKDRVKKYADEMLRNCWDENGVPIIFNDKQQLLDGQHRLSAVVKSGMTVKMLVVTGVQSGCKTIDRGMGRTVGQWCKSEGIQHGKTVASIARLVGLYDNDKWASATPKDGWGDSKVFEYIEENKESLVECSRMAASVMKIIPQSILGTILHIGCERGNPYEYQDAVWFVERLKTGENLSAVDPVFHLRNKLLAATHRSACSPIMKRALATLAWNKTIQGETTHILAIRMTGPRAMSMPSTILTAERSSGTMELTPEIYNAMKQEVMENVMLDPSKRQR